MAHSRVGVFVGFVFLAGAAAQGQQGGLERRVAALEVRVAAAEERLAAQGLQLDAALNQLSTLNARTVVLEQATGSLAAGVDALDVRTAALEQITGRASTVTVDCDANEKISDALSLLSNRLGVVTIRVSGTCTENLRVARPQTIIEGSPSAVITPADAGRPVVSAQGVAGGGPMSLALRNLTISGGSSSDGVSAGFGAHVEIDNVRVTGFDNGVAVSHRALVQIQASTIDSNYCGVAARDGSHLVISGTTIRDNQDYGLNLENGTTAVVAASSVTGNRGGGPGSIRGAVGLYQSSTLKIANTEISHNTGNGIFGAAGSVLWIDEGVKIDANGGHGIAMLDTGVVGKFYMSTNITLTNNGGYGVSCSPSPGVAQLYGFPPAGNGLPEANVAGNTLGAFSCPGSPNPPWEW